MDRNLYEYKLEDTFSFAPVFCYGVCGVVITAMAVFTLIAFRSLKRRARLGVEKQKMSVVEWPLASEIRAASKRYKKERRWHKRHSSSNSKDSSKRKPPGVFEKKELRIRRFTILDRVLDEMHKRKKSKEQMRRKKRPPRPSTTVSAVSPSPSMTAAAPAVRTSPAPVAVPFAPPTVAPTQSVAPTPTTTTTPLVKTIDKK